MTQIPRAHQQRWWYVGLLMVVIVITCQCIHTNVVQAQQPRPTLTLEPRPTLTPQSTKEPTRKPKKKQAATSTSIPPTSEPTTTSTLELATMTLIPVTMTPELITTATPKTSINPRMLPKTGSINHPFYSWLILAGCCISVGILLRSRYRR